MGEQITTAQVDGPAMRAFMKRLLADVNALEQMLDEGVVESGIRRIGAEQEMFLVDEAMRPAAVNMEVLAHLDDRFTTELGRFNMEANLPPLLLGGACLSELEAELTGVVEAARAAASREGAEVLLVGVAPTLELTDLNTENMTPLPRYRALNDALMRLRGDEYQFFVKGTDEIRVSANSVMLEACNTSFQVHVQVGPEEFARVYNMAQVATGPVLACAVNSPLLFGKDLWRETRIALFEQAVDTRRATQHLREVHPRVGFGNQWVDESVLEIFREDIMRFRAILADAREEDPFAVLESGGVPELHALRLHNSTVYRWNRACYGILDGKPHLRIENRVLPSGPTTHDEVANAAFWLGLTSGLMVHHPNAREHISFGDTRANFLSASRRGLSAQLRWLDGEVWPARDLILEELIPLAREGLASSDVAAADIDRYLGTIEDRARSSQTGATWMLGSLSAMGEDGSRVERLRAVTRAMLVRQSTGQPVHAWPIAEISEAGGWKENFLRVDQYMTTDLITVNQDELVDLVASLMKWRNISHVPVEDSAHRLVGLVAVRELLPLVAQGLPEGEGTHVPVSEIMDPEPVTVPPDTPTLAAIRCMRERKVRCVLVVDGDELVGLVTEHDFMNIAAHLLEERLRS